MRLLSFRHAGKESYGAVHDEGVVDLGLRLGARAPTLAALLRADLLDAAYELVAKTRADFALADIEYLPPIPTPGKIACIGINYHNRNEEYRDDAEAPRYPSVFMRTPESLVGHEQPILRPFESEQLDYEGEIALVIGRAGRRIPASRAWEHVAGLSLINEGSVGVGIPGMIARVGELGGRLVLRRRRRKAGTILVAMIPHSPAKDASDKVVPLKDETASKKDLAGK